MKSLLTLIFLTFFFLQAKTQTIHLLQLVDESNLDKFSLVTQKGEEHVEKVFDTMAKVMKYGKVRSTTLTNNQFNSDELNSAIEKMKVDTNDIVVFYYSGQVDYPSSSKSDYPYLNLNDKQTSFDQVCDRISKKGARLNIALADCRNNRLKLEIPTEPKSDKRNTGIINNLHYEIVSNLLKTTSGLVKIVSQQKGGLSNVFKRIRFEKETPQSGYVLKIDPEEYSIFSVAFADVFERLLTQKNTYLEFPNLINAIQYNINWELNPTELTKREQTLASDITYKGKTDLSKESWDKLPSNNETFEFKLNQLLDIKDKNSRKLFIENMIKKFQNDDFELFVWSISEPEFNINQDKARFEYASVADYLKRFEKYRPIINSVRFDDRSLLKKLFAENKKLIMREYYND